MPFRLDYLRLDGQTGGCVRADLNGGVDTPDFTCEHASTARRHASEAAIRAECDVLVSRVTGLDVRPAYVITPTGERKPPPGVVVMARENCKRDTGQACFCSACRAERRSQR